MKLQLFALAAVGLVFGTGGDCCGVGLPQLAARDAMPAQSCAWMDCPVALGTEAEVFVLASDNPEVQIASATLDFPSLADVSVVEGRVRITARAAGTSMLHTKLADGEPMDRYLTFAPRASTVVTSSLETRTYSPGRPQVFEGATFTVHAVHRDADGLPMLGHGIESWSIAGGTLREIADDGYVDTARIREVTGSVGLLVVHATTDDTPLEVDVLPAGSTAQLRLDLSGNNYPSRGTRRTVPVEAFSADGRFIAGIPPGRELSATTADPNVATAQVIPGQRALDVFARAPGMTSIVVTFDGITTYFAIVVQ